MTLLSRRLPLKYKKKKSHFQGPFQLLKKKKSTFHSKKMKLKKKIKKNYFLPTLSSEALNFDNLEPYC